MKLLFSFFFCFCFLNIFSQAYQNYSFDSTFNGNGQVFVPKRGLSTSAYSIVRQPDGKLLVGGEIALPHPLWHVGSFFLYRLDSNGQIDVTFGDTGKVQSKQNPVVAQQTADQILTMTVQPDGKIIAAGAFNDNVGIMRYHSNGAIDSTFGVNGLVEMDLGANANEVVRSIILLNNGSFIVGGDGPGPDFLLIKYKPNGVLDTTFGNSGIVLTDLYNHQMDDHCASILLQPDGKIVAAGYRWENGTGFDIALVRYNANGSIDLSFGTNGVATHDFGTIHDYGSKVHLKSNGNLIVTGFTTAGGDGKNKYAAVEFLSSGALNTSFGNNGQAIASTNQKENFSGSSVLLPNNDVLMCGNSNDFSTNLIVPLFMKITSNGQFDYSLNTNGFMYYTSSATNSQIEDMLVQPDGKIVGCGKSNLPGDLRFDVVRFKKLTVVNTTGIEEQQETGFTAYPNPVSDIIHVTTEGDHDFAISLYDALGELILKQENKTTVDLSGFPNGVYTIEYNSLKTKNYRINKFVKVF